MNFYKLLLFLNLFSFSAQASIFDNIVNKLTRWYNDYTVSRLPQKAINQVESLIEQQNEKNLDPSNIYELFVYQEGKNISFSKKLDPKKFAKSPFIGKIKRYISADAIQPGINPLKHTIYWGYYFYYLTCNSTFTKLKEIPVGYSVREMTLKRIIYDAKENIFVAKPQLINEWTCNNNLNYVGVILEQLFQKEKITSEYSDFISPIIDSELQILALDKNSLNTQTINSVYKKLALQYHPDKNRGNAESTEKFKQISDAKEFLIKLIDSSSNFAYADIQDHIFDNQQQNCPLLEYKTAHIPQIFGSSLGAKKLNQINKKHEKLHADRWFFVLTNK